MLFETYGDRNKPAVLFFHAMGVSAPRYDAVSLSGHQKPVLVEGKDAQKAPLVRRRCHQALLSQRAGH